MEVEEATMKWEDKIMEIGMELEGGVKNFYGWN